MSRVFELISCHFELLQLSSWVRALRFVKVIAQQHFTNDRHTNAIRRGWLTPYWAAVCYLIKMIDYWSFPPSTTLFLSLHSAVFPLKFNSHTKHSHFRSIVINFKSVPGITFPSSSMLFLRVQARWCLVLGYFRHIASAAHSFTPSHLLQKRVDPSRRLFKRFYSFFIRSHLLLLLLRWLGDFSSFYSIYSLNLSKRWWCATSINKNNTEYNFFRLSSFVSYKNNRQSCIWWGEMHIEWDAVKYEQDKTTTCTVKNHTSSRNSRETVDIRW